MLFLKAERVYEEVREEASWSLPLHITTVYACAQFSEKNPADTIAIPAVVMATALAK